MKTELKNCPFCAGKVKKHMGFGGIKFIDCQKCGVCISFKDVSGKSAQVAGTDGAFNRRVTE